MIVHRPSGRKTGSVMCGDFAYHAVPANLMAIAAFRHHVIPAGCAFCVAAANATA